METRGISFGDIYIYNLMMQQMEYVSEKGYHYPTWLVPNPARPYMWKLMIQWDVMGYNSWI